MQLSPIERDFLEVRARRRAAMKKHRAARRSNLGNCPTCGAREVRLTRDHIIPKSKGGSNDLKNIQWICRDCNAEKADSLTWVPPIERS